MTLDQQSPVAEAAAFLGNRPHALAKAGIVISHGHAAAAAQQGSAAIPIMVALALAWPCSSALCLTSEEITAKLRAAGYSIKTYKVVKEGTVRSLIVDSTGHIAEVAR